MNSRAPLPPGSVIQYADEIAEVVEDFGGSSLTVRADGITQKWYWTHDGATCTVVSIPEQHDLTANEPGL